MPLDPSISLQAKPVQIQPLDLTKTLLSVAQLRNLMSEADLRQLQTADLGETMRQYKGMTATGGIWDQLRDTYQPGSSQTTPANVPALWRNPPGPPPSQADMIAPGAGGEVYPQMSPTRAMDQLSPGVQAPPGTTYGRAPEALQAPAARPVEAQVLAPGAAEPQTRPAPAPAPQLPQLAQTGGMDTEAQLAHRKQLLQELRFRYPKVAGPVIKSFLDIDTQVLTLHKTQLDLQGHMMNGMYQLMASVQAQPEAERPAAYQQALQAAATLYGQKATATMSPTYDAQQVEFYATNARDETKRIEQATAQHEALTRRHEALTKQAQLGEVEWKQTAKGEWFSAAKYPGAQTGAFGGTAPGAGPGGVSTPAVNPLTGQPYTSMEAEKFKDEQQGTITAQHQAASQSFREASLAMGMIRQSAHPADPKAGQVSDQALADNYFKLMMPANQRNAPDSQVREMARRGNLGEQASRLWERLFGTGGAPLEQEDRDRILAHAETLYTQQGEDYDKNVRGPAIARLKALPGGPTVPAEQLIPDARTTAPGPGGAKGGKVVTKVQVTELVKRYGGTEAEMRQRLQAAGKQVE